MDDPEKIIVGLVSFLGGLMTALLTRFVPGYKELMDDNARLREENEGLRDIRQDDRESEAEKGRWP